MKVIFLQEFNSSQQGFDEGQVCEMTPKQAKPFIKDKIAKKATNAEVKAAEEAAEKAKADAEAAKDAMIGDVEEEEKPEEDDK